MKFDIRDFIFKPEDRGIGHFLCVAVAEGMWPWKPTDIELYNEFDIDFNRYRLLARARSGLAWDFAGTVYVDRDDLLDMNLEWMEETCRELTAIFRNRQDWPLPTNIILGED